MNKYDFDQIHERRGTDSLKWQAYGSGVLPLWVADMDFQAPPEVLRALHARINHGVFGYGGVKAELAKTICNRLWQNYRWEVTPDQLVFLPGLVSGLNVVAKAVCTPNSGVLVQTPVYPPFLSAAANQGLKLDIAELDVIASGPILHYRIDFNALVSAIQPHTRLFMLCNPHNPVGRSYDRDELQRIAEICLRHDLVICSDEIHCELQLDDTEHIPIASLSPELAECCITLMAPSKTFNIAGLYSGFAIIQNPSLRKQVHAVMAGLVPEINLLGLTAALAAYNECEQWRTELLAYLKGNRDFVVSYIAEHLPMLRTTIPESTYLAWIDCQEAGFTGNPHTFFVQQAGVALNDGEPFGPGGSGFVRLNFGCPRSTLTQALEQMRTALK
ncbi:PatB family C-S lyase [Methylomonas sp. AM2-LC]|uniref:MalY/PatB family protein n=1 Tax=Methylomonas sp. AM2-LC TaxID=3153301 RepID=UPI003263CA48